jgi:hypothetical protein
LDANGQILESSPMCFNLTVCGYLIEDRRSDLTFEPGETIRLGQVCIKNVGGLTCPPGAFVSFPSTATANFAADQFPLPQMAPGQIITIDHVFNGTIFDIPEPVQPGPYTGKASFQSQVQLLGRSFYASFVASEINLAYPVLFQSLSVPVIFFFFFFFFFFLIDSAGLKRALYVEIPL